MRAAGFTQTERTDTDSLQPGAATELFLEPTSLVHALHDDPLVTSLLQRPAPDEALQDEALQCMARPCSAKLTVTRPCSSKLSPMMRPDKTHRDEAVLVEALHNDANVQIEALNGEALLGEVRHDDEALQDEALHGEALLGEAHHDEALLVEALLDEALRDEAMLSEALTAMRPYKTRLCMARHR